MKRIALVALVSLALLITPLTAIAGAAKYLYVGSLLTRYRPYAYSVERYPLEHGIPADSPDLTYDGAVGPIWVDHANRLYALSYSLGSYSIVEYESNGTHQLRHVLIATSGGSSDYDGVFTGLLVGPGGYLYLAAQAQQYTLDMPCAWEISVFAPGAHDRAKPAQCLPGAGAYALAQDAEGSLYLANSQIGRDAIFVIARPAKAPRIARVISVDGAFQPVAAAIEGESLYVLHFGYCGEKGCRAGVSVVPADSSGRVKPERTLWSPWGAAWTGGIAVDATRLFVATGNEVLIYDKSARDHDAPLAKLKYKANNITFVALGF